MVQPGLSGARLRAVLICSALLLGVLGLVAFSPRSARSAPYVPEDDEEVLERLRKGAVGTAVPDLRARRAGLGEGVERGADRALLARELIERYRREGDPRHLGQAQAALGPYWNTARPPFELRLLRATLRQSSHDFSGALEDLGELVRERPEEPQPWLSRAVVLNVLGRYGEASEDCERLRSLGARAVVEACLVGPRSMTGNGRAAREALVDALSGARRLSGTESDWADSTLAELEWRLGLTREAADRFERMTSAGRADPYTLGAYADLLIDVNRANRALELLAPYRGAESLLLRYAIAARKLRLEGARALTDELEQRFRTAHQRGDRLHLREAARFALELGDDPARALERARENWAIQREWWDARIFLEAALAAGRPELARPVVEFLHEAGCDDRTLRALGERVERAKGE